MDESFPVAAVLWHLCRGPHVNVLAQTVYVLEQAGSWTCTVTSSRLLGRQLKVPDVVDHRQGQGWGNCHPGAARVYGPTKRVSSDWWSLA